MRRTRGIAGALLIAGLTLAGCSSAGSDSADYDAGPQRGYDDHAAADAEAESAGYDAGGPAPAQGGGAVEVREIITTAEVSIVVVDPVDSATEVVQLVETSGGRVDQRTVRAESIASDGSQDYPASAYMAVRIPAAELDSFLTDLGEIGEVGEVTQSSEDVTQIAQDLDARIEALETSTDRLLEIMAEADDTEDLIAIEQALSQRQADLESLRTQRAYLSDQVALSTVYISLTAAHDPVIDAGGFTGGLQTGWHALITFVSALLALSGMLLPWLVVLAIPAGLIFVVIRRRRSRPGTAAPGAMVQQGTGAAAPWQAAAPGQAAPGQATTPGQAPAPSHDPGTPDRSENS